jgi:hypothetical protein
MFCFITRLFSFFIGKDKFLVLSYRVPFAQENLSLVCVEGLNCKRPVQCLAFTKILTTHTPSPPDECGAGGRTHSLGVEGVGGQYFVRRQTLLCTLHMQVLCACMYLG